MKKAILVVSFGTSYPETREKRLKPVKKKWPKSSQITTCFVHSHPIKSSKN